MTSVMGAPDQRTGDLSGVPSREQAEQGVFAYWPRFLPLYDRIEELLAVLAERDAQIERLLDELEDTRWWLDIRPTVEINDVSIWQGWSRRVQREKRVAASAGGAEPEAEENP